MRTGREQSEGNSHPRTHGSRRDDNLRLFSGVDTGDVVKVVPDRVTGRDYSAYRFAAGDLVLSDATASGLV